MHSQCHITHIQFYITHSQCHIIHNQSDITQIRTTSSTQSQPHHTLSAPHHTQIHITHCQSHTTNDESHITLSTTSHIVTKSVQHHTGNKQHTQFTGKPANQPSTYFLATQQAQRARIRAQSALQSLHNTEPEKKQSQLISTPHTHTHTCSHSPLPHKHTHQWGFTASKRKTDKNDLRTSGGPPRKMVPCFRTMMLSSAMAGI